MQYSAFVESLRDKVRFSFSRSSGAGGQNVNKVNTKVYAAVSIKALAGLSEGEQSALRKNLGGRINKEDEVFVLVQDERTQERNRDIAVERLTALIVAACHIPKKRKKRGVSPVAKELRLRAKKLRAKVLRDRREFVLD
jgi:ribosome-associated protein